MGPGIWLPRFKICGPYVVALFNWTSIFESYMERLVKNRHSRNVLRSEWTRRVCSNYRHRFWPDIL